MMANPSNRTCEARQRVGVPADSDSERSASERRSSGERAVLIVDAGGAVRFCGDNAARLFVGGSDGIIGQPIRSLIPDLPLQRATPGYNVAYARFMAAQDDWQRLHRSGSGGPGALVEFKLRPAQRRQDDPYAFVVRLRWLTAVAEPAASAPTQ